MRRHALRLLALAQTGLTYGRDLFDGQRYEETREIGLALLALVTRGDAGELWRIVTAETGYATPKVDVRAAVFDDRNRILLIRERSDGLWTLPGGWSDVLESPSEAVVREVREEAGVVVEVVKLAAVLDRERQGNKPPLPFHVYQLFFICRRIADGVPLPAETLDVKWFDPNELPPLSESRVTAEQVRLMDAHHRVPGRPTTFD